MDIVGDRNKAVHGEIDKRKNLEAIELSGFYPVYPTTIQEQEASVACPLLNNLIKKMENGLSLKSRILAKKKIAVCLYRT